ncbi:MAG: hypothetical protein ACYDAK_06090 [Candidatus Limnocylindrales bacterium]
MRRTREGEIELVGYDRKLLVLAGEAKWSKGPEGGGALAQLRRAVTYVPGYDPARTKLALYTREGFTDEFRVRAHAEGAILRTVADIFTQVLSGPHQTRAEDDGVGATA